LRNELGAALLEAGDAAGAAKEFEAVLRKQPTHAGAHNNLALALERTGKFDEALKEYERALALDGSLSAAASNRAALFARRGQHEEARLAFLQAVERDPRSAQAHANLGALLRAAPAICEVSIGHALIGEALYAGLSATVATYRRIIAEAHA